MAKKKTEEQVSLSTEEKIMEAARNIFTRKGFAAARTRDIAEEAGINLALLNYYFRSKQKLFDRVMAEKMRQFFGAVAPVMMDHCTTLEAKISHIACHYIDLLRANPDLPLFVLNEIRNNTAHFAESMQVGSILRESSFVLQLKQKRPDIHPLQFVLSLLGMIIFPFIGRPVFNAVQALDDGAFNRLMDERKKLIPHWMGMMLNTV